MRQVNNALLAVVMAFAMAAPLSLRSADAAKPAPAFTLPTATGAQYSLEAQRGKRVVISFYKSYY